MARRRNAGDGILGVVLLFGLMSATCRQCFGCDDGASAPSPPVADVTSHVPVGPRQRGNVESAAAVARGDGTCSARIHRKGGGGREEPQLVGSRGYIVAEPEYELRGPTRWQKGWTAAALVQTGPEAWRPNGPVLRHKTPVTVVAQNLRHAGYGSYSGVLTVALEDGTQHTIGIGNFVEYPFWNCPFALPRSEPEFWTNSSGVVIAKLKDGAKAVDRDGEWTSLKPREHLLCDINIRPYSNKLECTVLDSRDRQQDRVEVNPEDARIVY